MEGAGAIPPTLQPQGRHCFLQGGVPFPHRALLLRNAISLMAHSSGLLAVPILPQLRGRDHSPARHMDPPSQEVECETEKQRTEATCSAQASLKGPRLRLRKEEPGACHGPAGFSTVVESTGPVTFQHSCVLIASVEPKQTKDCGGGEMETRRK